MPFKRNFQKVTGVIFRSASTLFVTHLFSHLCWSMLRELGRCCVTAKIGQFSEEFISVPGQRDLQHMHSAICSVPHFPLTNT